MTDANVVLGHLPPQLLGGEMSLDVEAARTAVQTIADAMGLASVEEAAEGILAIVNENMAGALRLVSVQRGHDPRDFALVAYGGAGPLHANAVAELMGSFPVLVPPAPGLLCAIGDLVADFRDEFAQTYIRLLSARRSRPRSHELLDGLGAPGRRVARRARGSRTSARTITLHAPTCATTARATRSRSPSTRTRSARSASPTSRSASTGSTSSSTASACPARRAEIVNLRAVGFGSVPKPELAVGEPRRRGRVRRDRRRARGLVRRRSSTRRRSTTASKLAAADAVRRARRS